MKDYTPKDELRLLSILDDLKEMKPFSVDVMADILRPDFYLFKWKMGFFSFPCYVQQLSPIHFTYS